MALVNDKKLQNDMLCAVKKAFNELGFTNVDKQIFFNCLVDVKEAITRNDDIRNVFHYSYVVARNFLRPIAVERAKNNFNDLF